MSHYYYENEDRPVSRSEKIREAKSAFSQNVGRSAGRSYNRDFYAGNSLGREGIQVKPGTTDVWEQTELHGGKNHYGILRMVTAGVLFFVLILSFHLKMSYHGFDKAYVEKILSEDGHLEGFVRQAVQTVKQIVPK